MATNEGENDSFANGTPVKKRVYRNFANEKYFSLPSCARRRTNRSTIARFKKASFEQSTEQQLFQQRPRQLARNRG